MLKERTPFWVTLDQLSCDAIWHLTSFQVVCRFTYFAWREQFDLWALYVCSMDGIRSETISLVEKLTLVGWEKVLLSRYHCTCPVVTRAANRWYICNLLVYDRLWLLSKGNTLPIVWRKSSKDS